jgi:hypothetical protein
MAGHDTRATLADTAGAGAARGQTARLARKNWIDDDSRAPGQIAHIVKYVADDLVTGREGK